MTLSTILSLLFGSGLLISVGRYFIGRIKAIEAKNEATCKGVQALLRDRLLATYNHYLEKGYAPIYAKENFQNMWIQYHTLGENGVMDEIHEKFLALPDRRLEENEN